MLLEGIFNYAFKWFLECLSPRLTELQYCWCRNIVGFGETGRLCSPPILCPGVTFHTMRIHIITMHTFVTILIIVASFGCLCNFTSIFTTLKKNLFFFKEICLDRPIIEPCSYQKGESFVHFFFFFLPKLLSRKLIGCIISATQILASAKRKEGKGSLEPLISARMKLGKVILDNNLWSYCKSLT